MSKAAAFLRRLSGTAFLAGLAVLGMGAYWLLFKAGIPYQDPTVDMQIAYGIRFGVGEALVRLGAPLMATGGAVNLALRLFSK